MVIRHLILALAGTLAIAASAPAQGRLPRLDGGTPSSERPNLLKDVDLVQKLDAQLPLSAPFRDETGRDVTLGEYFHKGRPVVLVMMYYECPMLCSQVLNGLITSLRPLNFEPGKEFDVVGVSINPKEMPGLARDKKKAYLEDYNRPQTAGGWHFLTGDEPAIKQVANAIGFQYAYDEEIKQYAHPAAITVVTPEGRVSRYFYGIEYSSRDLRLGLVEASANRIGSPADRIMLLCYHYDPATGKYGAMTMRLVRTGGAFTVLGLGSFWFVMFRRERRMASERR
jgi:protein SCO1/2